jgi:hypothetical protein
MAIALLANTGAGSSDANAVTTTGINTAGASLIVLLVSTASNLTPTDSQSNTWTGLTVRTGAFGGDLRLWYVASPTTHASHTFSASGTGENPTICAAAFSGTAASPFDQQNGAYPLTQPISPGSITPSEDNCLVVTGAGVYTTTSMTVDSPYTMLNAIAGVGGLHWDGNLAYHIQTTATATNPVFVTSAEPTDSTAVVVASFKAASVASVNYGKLIFRNREYV